MRRLLSLFLILSTALSVVAVENRQYAARQRAMQVLGVPVELVAQGAGSQPTYFVYNTQQAQAGFVVVADDGNETRVIGHSTTGSYDADDVPPALRLWLARMDEELTMLREGRAEPFRATEVHEAVDPLMTTKWNQQAPYNLETPEYESGQHSATGCLATAMAQIMKYYAHDAGSTAIPSYTSADLDLLMPELPATTFDYALMHDSYSSGNQSASAREVARLMKYCGQAVETNYGPSSGAEPMVSAFANYFDYNPFAYFAERYQYPAWAWDRLIYNQLSDGHPVLMTGYTFSEVGYEGHAFICHGYDGNGLYYFNWGWGGRYDGWYALSLCNPLGQGTGGSHGLDGFNIYQGAMINVFPGVMPNTNVRMTASALTVDEHVVTRSSVSEGFIFMTSVLIYNMTAAAHSFDLGLGLYDTNDQLLGTWTHAREMLCMPYTGLNLHKLLNFAEDMSSGTYIMRCICRDSNTSQWLWDYNGDVYLILNVDGNTLTISEPEPDLVVNSVSFEGSLQPRSKAVMHVSLSNVGPTLYNNLYLFINDQQASGVGLFVDQGETDDVVLHFVVPEGDVQLKLYTDAVLVDRDTHTYQPGGKLIWSGGLEGFTGIAAPMVTPAKGGVVGSDGIATYGTAPLFDLQGRRVQQPIQKGVYIQQGRKYVVK